MKNSVLLWGFNSTPFVSKIIKRFRKDSIFKEINIQISKDKKTTDLIESAPDEIIRFDVIDFEGLYQFLKKNQNKDVQIIINTYSLLSIENLEQKSQILKKIFALDNRFVLICPKIETSLNGIDPEFKKLKKIFLKTQFLSKRLKFIYELFLNSITRVSVLSCPTPLFILKEAFNPEFFETQEFIIFPVVPDLLSYYEALFISDNALIDEITKLLNNKKPSETEKSLDLNDFFKKNLAADLKNEHYVKPNQSFLKRIFDFRIRKALDSYMIKDSKNSKMFSYWIVYKSILEAHNTHQANPVNSCFFDFSEVNS